MDNRDILLVGGGLFIGYLLASKKRSKDLSTSNVVSNTQSQTLPPATAGGSVVANETSQSGETLVDPKIDFCKQNWIEYSKTKRFGSSESMQNTYDNFMTSCIGKL